MKGGTGKEGYRKQRVKGVTWKRKIQGAESERRDRNRRIQEVDNERRDREKEDTGS